jgi:hypothetical protein
MLHLALLFISDRLGAVFPALRDDRAQGIMEYAILIGGIALIAGVALLGTGGLDFGDFIDRIQDCVSFDADCA